MVYGSEDGDLNRVEDGRQQQLSLGGVGARQDGLVDENGHHGGEEDGRHEKHREQTQPLPRDAV